MRSSALSWLPRLLEVDAPRQPAADTVLCSPSVLQLAAAEARIGELESGSAAAETAAVESQTSLVTLQVGSVLCSAVQMGFGLVPEELCELAAGPQQTGRLFVSLASRTLCRPSPPLLQMDLSEAQEALTAREAELDDTKVRGFCRGSEAVEAQRRGCCGLRSMAAAGAAAECIGSFMAGNYAAGARRSLAACQLAPFNPSLCLPLPVLPSRSAAGA